MTKKIIKKESNNEIDLKPKKRGRPRKTNKIETPKV